MTALPDKIPQEMCPMCGGQVERQRTFAEVFGNVTDAERRELVYQLAAMRARKTIETLLPATT